MSLFRRQAAAAVPAPAHAPTPARAPAPVPVPAPAPSPAPGGVAASPVSIFKVGSIVERTSSGPPPALLPVCAAGAGFPNLRHTRPLGAAPATRPPGLGAAAPAPTPVKRTPPPDKARASALAEEGWAPPAGDADGFKADNLNTVLAMTKEQVDEALAEAGLHFSQDTLKFLQKRGEAELHAPPGGSGRGASGAPGPAPAGHTPEVPPAPAGKARPAVLPPSEGTSAGLAGADDRTGVGAGTMPGPEHEHAWMDPTFESDAALKQHSGNALSMADRFDLEGRKIVSKETFVSHFVSIVKGDHFFRDVVSPALKGGEAAASGIVLGAAEQLFSRAVADGVCCDGAALGGGEGGAECDRDLFHHEYEQGRAGYSLHEACEVGGVWSV
jgi:hypothetical protein